MCNRSLHPAPQAGPESWWHADDTTEFTFSKGLDAPATIVLTDAPDSVKKMVSATGAKVIEKNGLSINDYEALSKELTEKGFDDIVMLNPTSAEVVGQAARFIARRGTLNLVGTRPLDGLADVDLGRLHYDYIVFRGQQHL